MSSKDTVAVLGTGIMGAPMARNLLAAGFPVRAWNRTRGEGRAARRRRRRRRGHARRGGATARRSSSRC